MTHKDCILIARALRQSLLDHGQTRRDAVLSVAVNISELLKQDNPHFKHYHFLDVVLGKKSLTSKPPRKKKIVVLSARGLRLADNPHAAGCAAGRADAKEGE